MHHVSICEPPNLYIVSRYFTRPMQPSLQPLKTCLFALSTLHCCISSRLTLVPRAIRFDRTMQERKCSCTQTCSTGMIFCYILLFCFRVRSPGFRLNASVVGASQVLAAAIDSFGLYVRSNTRIHTGVLGLCCCS